MAIKYTYYIRFKQSKPKFKLLIVESGPTYVSKI